MGGGGGGGGGWGGEGGGWKGRRLTFPAHVNKTKSTIKTKSMEPILRVPLALEKLNVSLKSSTEFGASGN